ncbi:hypothetical protein QTV49_001819 [Vibrio vulnificus]|nr:hypothetical protein [Vibrio vulnificus]
MKLTAEEVQDYINNLVEKYKYRKLPKALSDEARRIYHRSMPDWCSMDGNDEAVLSTKSGTIVAIGYIRVVVGDYGAYVEFRRSQAVRENICAKKGQEYRYRDPNFVNSVKYFWYTAKDSSDVKIYFQQKKVTYADYLPERFYISPFELEFRER